MHGGIFAQGTKQTRSYCCLKTGTHAITSLRIDTLLGNDLQISDDIRLRNRYVKWQQLGTATIEAPTLPNSIISCSKNWCVYRAVRPEAILWKPAKAWERGSTTSVNTDPSSRQRGRPIITNPLLSKDNFKEWKWKLLTGPDSKTDWPTVRRF
jgi:hypothetical protein